MENTNKEKIVGIYFNESQMNDLREVAENLGMKMAAFCRFASLRVMREEQIILNKSLEVSQKA